MSYPIICEISLEKLKENALKVKKLLGNKTKFYAVVKSDAYGHGIVPIASEIYSVVNGYCVSLTSEAIKLRVSGIDKEILMLTPVFSETVEELIRYNITISVSSLSDILLVEKTAIKLNKKAKIQLAINTGMNRLGFNGLTDLLNSLNYLKTSSFILLTGAYSHFGNTLNKEYTERQFRCFNYLTKAIKKQFKNLTYHISASGGLLLDKKYLLNACRVGLLLYGYKPFESNKINVEPIMQVYAKRVSVQNNVKGKNLLYGDNLCNVNDATIIRLGYADGFLRRGLSNSINEMCMDISAIKGEENANLIPIMTNAEELAKNWNTICYEVLVNVTKRAETIYKK